MTAYLSASALRGDAAARDAFLPIQVLDQAVFWRAFKTRSVPRRAAVLAATTSAAIVALDLRRRAADRTFTSAPSSAPDNSPSSFSPAPDNSPSSFSPAPDTRP